MTRRFASTASDVLFKLVLMVLAFAAASLLLRNALAIGARVPLDPNEGWNAYLARAAISGGPLYPHGLMVNNYPPLSFLLLGALSHVTGDAVIAGRLVSLAAFFAITGSIIVSLREMGAGVAPSLFGGLFFALSLLAASDYVAMNDPQLLGHALQLAALPLLLQGRRESVLAALLMTLGLFVKHNLLALPLASALWLLLQDRREGLRFVLAGLGFCVSGWLATRFFLGADLMSVLASPRRWALENFRAQAVQFLSWSAIALAVTLGLAWAGRGRPAPRFVIFYTAAALTLGGLFAFGDGVDANIFFDATIALCLASGLALTQMAKPWRGALAGLTAAPLLFYLAGHVRDGGFHYSDAFARESAGDIAFVHVHPGPALCEDLTLCYWAQKAAPVDVFNLSEAFLTHRRSDDELAGLIQNHRFGAIVLSSMTPFPLGPRLRALLLANYRIVRQDDNGAFLEPISPNTPP